MVRQIDVSSHLVFSYVLISECHREVRAQEEIYLEKEVLGSLDQQLTCKLPFKQNSDLTSGQRK